MRRLRSFNYFQPKTVSEAIHILVEQSEGAYPLAGGTDLLVQMKRGNLRPTVLVDLKRIEGLNRIEEERGKGIAIGPLTSISAIEASSLLRLKHPVLTEAANVLGSPFLRNLGTLGGNIGRASPASDMVPSLIVLSAQVFIEGPGGKRDLPLEEMFTGPGTTALSRGELITSISLPERNPHSGATYLKLGRRQGADCALVGVAVSLTLVPGKTEVKDVRVALSAVAPVPLRARKAEGVLRSGPLNEERIKEAAAVTVEECSPITDMRATANYRKEMVRVLTSKAISRAWTIAERGDNAS